MAFGSHRPLQAREDSNTIPLISIPSGTSNRSICLSDTIDCSEIDIPAADTGLVRDHREDKTGFSQPAEGFRDLRLKNHLGRVMEIVLFHNQSPVSIKEKRLPLCTHICYSLRTRIYSDSAGSRTHPVALASMPRMSSTTFVVLLSGTKSPVSTRPPRARTRSAPMMLLTV